VYPILILEFAHRLLCTAAVVLVVKNGESSWKMVPYIERMLDFISYVSCGVVVYKALEVVNDVSIFKEIQSVFQFQFSLI
jgi:hypothetical protein